tara:strand:+ start:767 stop:970 length:204 start_codon:yes stop_codon:yes gene_type:complete
MKDDIANFKLLIKYTQEDIDNLYWDYDRMSTSGQETLDRLAKMYNLRHDPKTGNLYGHKGEFDAILK